jgi:hypothetical protein
MMPNIPAIYQGYNKLNSLKKIAKKKRNYGKLVSIIGTAEITKDSARH